MKKLLFTFAPYIMPSYVSEAGEPVKILKHLKQALGLDGTAKVLELL